jgi:hypothetical protein
MKNEIVGRVVDCSRTFQAGNALYSLRICLSCPIDGRRAGGNDLRLAAENAARNSRDGESNRALRVVGGGAFPREHRLRRRGDSHQARSKQSRSADSADGWQKEYRFAVRTPKAGALYFALVFGAGFVLGTIRTVWFVPRLGARTAELLEVPVMLAVSYTAARWAVRRLGVPRAAAARLGMGLIALGLMLAAEFGFVLWLRSLTIQQYITSRDPVARAVYYVSLFLYAVFPLLVKHKQS